ncbi:MAG: hypothetical protein RR244_01205 [Oscillospiraceae bacterium]
MPDPHRVTINPKDIIIGDVDGVAVIPGAIAEKVMDEAFETVNKETEVINGLERGASLQEMYEKNGEI